MGGNIQLTRSTKFNDTFDQCKQGSLIADIFPTFSNVNYNE